MTSTRVTRFIVLLTYIYMVGMNALATTLPLNGQSTNEISDRYDTLFAPVALHTFHLGRDLPASWCVHCVPVGGR
jgi:hypothetical protein